MRNNDGELKGFMNICRHRLHKVVDEGAGTGPVVRCHYHGWSYDLDGNLKGLPRSSEIYERDAEEFDPKNFGLLPVKVEMWGPLVFVNLDVNAGPLAGSLGRIPAISEARGLNFNTLPHEVDVRIVEANWKVFIDNVIECYHCPTVHPDFSVHYDTAGRGVEIQCDDNRCTMAATPRDQQYKLDNPTELNFDYHAYFLPPNMWLSARGKEWMFLLITEPMSPNRIKVTSQFCFPEGMPAEKIKALVDGAIQVNEEDFGVARSVQKGHEVGGLPQGYYMPSSEKQIRNFAQYVFDALNDD